MNDPFKSNPRSSMPVHFLANVFTPTSGRKRRSTKRLLIESSYLPIFLVPLVCIILLVFISKEIIKHIKFTLILQRRTRFGATFTSCWERFDSRPKWDNVQSSRKFSLSLDLKLANFFFEDNNLLLNSNL